MQFPFCQQLQKTKKSRPMGNWLREIENILKENSRIYSVFSQKNCPLPCQIPESGRESEHQVGKTALKWLDNTVKPRPKIGWRNRQFSTIQQRKKPVTSFLSQAFGGSWWIRTTEALSSRFTVCPHWPLGKAPIFCFASAVSPGDVCYYSKGVSKLQAFF